MERLASFVVGVCQRRRFFAGRIDIFGFHVIRYHCDGVFLELWRVTLWLRDFGCPSCSISTTTIRIARVCVSGGRSSRHCRMR